MFIRIFIILYFLSPFYLSGCSNGSGDTNTSTESVLTIAVIGPGSVVSTDGSLDCGTTCSTTYTTENLLNLNAIPDTNSRFIGWAWAGCQSAHEPNCDVPVGPGRNNLKITAEFESISVKLYDITFEAPAHTVSMSPSFGVSEEYVSEYFPTSGGSVPYAPKVVDGHGLLASQVLIFQPVMNSFGTFLITDILTLALEHGADSYNIEFDLVVTEVASVYPLAILFDWARGNNKLEFNSSGEIHFQGSFIDSYTAGEKLHVIVEIDVVNKEVIFTFNETVTTALSLDVATDDINNMRIMLGGEPTSRVAIDNIRITALLNERLPLNEPDNADKYVIEFELPIITSPSGQSGHGAAPYSEDGFNITYPLRIDPAIAGSGRPTNGSVHAAFTYSSQPMLYHKYGYTYQLLSIDVAEYSSVIGTPSSDVVITGIKKSGVTVSKAIDKAMFGPTFNTVAFDSSWSDLMYVVIDNNVIAIDNITVKLNEERVGYPEP